MLLDLFNKNNRKLEVKLEKIFNEIFINHPTEELEGVFCCLEPWKSLKGYISKLNSRLICFTFSAVRKVHGYSDTLYLANMEGKLFCGEEAKERFINYSNNKLEGFDALENSEILALLGKKKNLTLLKYIDYKPEYEIGVCTGAFRCIPEIFNQYPYNEDDLIINIKKVYDNGEYIFRHHAYFLNQMGISRDNVRDDPAEFILSCKRIVSVASQINLKAILWKRTSILENKSNELSFFSQNKLESEEITDIDKINFLIFGYLVPDGLMFNLDYWRFRIKARNEKEIIHRHLIYYSEKFKIKESELYNKNEKERLRKILISRSAEKDLIEDILRENCNSKINFRVLKSRLDIIYPNGKVRSMWRRNVVEGEKIVSRFIINSDEVEFINGIKIYFSALDDIAGDVFIEKIIINNELVMDLKQSEKEMKKYEKIFLMDINAEFEEIELSIIWDYRVS